VLTKQPQRVYHPAVPYVPYRPYSKTCPTTTTPSGTSTTVCGTYSIDIAVALSSTGYSGDAVYIRIQTTSYSVPGVSIPSVIEVLPDVAGPVGHVGGGSYCVKVTTK